jgi:hypothetical protein
VERVRPHDQIEERAQAARGQGQPLTDEADPFGSLEQDEEAPETQGDPEWAQRAAAISREGDPRPEEKDGARKQCGGVEGGLAHREAWLVEGRPDRRRGFHDREGADHPREEHHLREDEEEHPEHGVGNELLSFRGEVKVPGAGGPHGALR